MKRVIRGRLGAARNVTYQVGSTALVLPANHALPAYRSKWRLYDEPLRMVAQALRQVKPDFRAIDIGANVGDSAAALGVEGSISIPVSVLCIEGDPAYLAHLRRNALALGSQVEVECCFVGIAPGSIAEDSLTRHDGTTSAARRLDSVNPIETGEGDRPDLAIPIQRLEQILARHPSFERSELIKLDTDGFDFSILLAHEELLAHLQPVLFFEYLVECERDAERARACLEMLTSIGYTDFLVFDNFGNLLLRTGDLRTMHGLDRYLLSNLAFGRAIHYFDVCAAAEADQEVLDLVSKRVAMLVERG